MRFIYISHEGGKPFNIGMNRAKRLARRSDKQDQRAVLKAIGPGLPRQHGHHQELVRARHKYYHEQHEEFLRGQPRTP
jgi:hypothetical protein